MYSGVIEMEHWQTKKQTRNVIKNFIVAFLAVKKKNDENTVFPLISAASQMSAAL